MIVEAPYQMEGWTRVVSFSHGSSGSVSLLAMTEEEMKQARKRKKKHPLGFAPVREKKPK